MVVVLTNPHPFLASTTSIDFGRVLVFLAAGQDSRTTHIACTCMY
jgi:hypothetical protein